VTTEITRNPPGRTAGAPVSAAETDLPPVPLQPVRGPYERWGKRALDLIGSTVGLVFLAPLLGLIALAIRLDTRGPIVYRSRRIGAGGRSFDFYKFRSMVDGAEALREQILHLNEVDGPVFKISRDPRVTRVGQWLRRTSLDELPQLWNVLCGQMSLVGPRPPIPEEVRQYEPWQLRRLSVRPGITCLWQIRGRSSVSFEEWMRLDMEYIDRLSLGLDLRILLLTLPAVLSGRGAC